MTDREDSIEPFNRAGAILGDSVLLEYLDSGWIFAKTTPPCWTPANLRPARYDLRLAADRLVIPVDPSIAPTGFERYPRGRMLPPFRAVELYPGAVALVSTEEKFCMPWDVSGTIALRFEQARRGLVALAGLFVDPGFGQAPAGDEDAGEERLHLLLANLGSETISLRAGDRIASIQFSWVAGATPGEPPRTTTTLDDEYFREDATKGPELGFVRRLLKSADETQDLRTRLNRIEDSIDRYAVFGVFLIATALIAAFGTVFVTTITSLKARHVVDWLLPHQGGLRALVLAVLIVSTVTLLYKMFALVYGAFENLHARSAQRKLSRLPWKRRRQKIRRVLMTIREDEWTTAADVAIAVDGESTYAAEVEDIAAREKALVGSSRILDQNGELPSWTDTQRRSDIRARLQAEGLPFNGDQADSQHRIRYRDLAARS